jgi:hypothetical protein
MAFPQVASTAVYHAATASASHTVSYPSGIQPGDGVMLLGKIGTADVDVSAMAGWSLQDSAETRDILLTRLIDGTEGATFDLELDAVVSSVAVAVLRITGGNVAAFVNPAGYLSATHEPKNGNSPNPASISTPYAGDNLFLTAWFDTTDSYQYDTSPIGYTEEVDYQASTRTSIIFSKESTAATDDPSPIQFPSVETGEIWTLVIRPADGFPYVAWANAQTHAQDTSFLIDLGPSHVGDLVIVCISKDDDNAPTPPFSIEGTWLTLASDEGGDGNSGNNDWEAVFAVVDDGLNWDGINEFGLDGDDEEGSSIVYRIRNWNDTGTWGDGIEAWTDTDSPNGIYGTDGDLGIGGDELWAAAVGASPTPSWGWSDDYLVLTGAGWDGNSLIVTWSSNANDNKLTAGGTGAGAAGIGAYTQEEDTSANGFVGFIDDSETTGGWVIFVRPSQAAPPVTGDFTLDAFIQPYFSVDAVIAEPGAGFSADAIILRPKHIQPVIGDISIWNSGTSQTSHDVTLPTSISAGDLLVMAFAADANGGMSVTADDAGWVTEYGIGSRSTGTISGKCVMFVKRATGSEGATAGFTTDASEGVSTICLRIEAGTWLDGEWGTVVNNDDHAGYAIGIAWGIGSATDTPNPPQWASYPTGFAVGFGLYLGFAGWDDGSTSLSAYPSNMPDDQTESRWASSQGFGVGMAAVISSQQDFDPGPFTLSGTEDTRAWTVLIAPWVPTLTADAFIQPYFTVGAWIYKDPVLGSFSADAIIRKVWGGTTTAYLAGNDSVYSGPDTTYSVVEAGIALNAISTLRFGASGIGGEYDIYEVFLEFNTAFVAPYGVKDVTFKHTVISETIEGGTFTGELRELDWGGDPLTTADWYNPTTAGGFALAATYTDTQWAIGPTHIWDSDAGFASIINTSGVTRFTVLSEHARQSTPPGAWNEFVHLNPATVRLEVEWGPIISLDAVIVVAQSASLTLDAFVQPSFTLDAVIDGGADTGDFTADAVIEASVATSLTADAVIAATVAGSLIADAIRLATSEDALFVDAVALRVQSGAVLADAVTTKGQAAAFTAGAFIQPFFTVDAVIAADEGTTETGSFTTDAVISLVSRCIWTTPADTVQMSGTPALAFNMPDATSGDMHFQIQIDTDSGFSAPTVYQSPGAGWEYWDGGDWQSIPDGGVTAAYVGNEARYTIQSPLSNDNY